MKDNLGIAERKHSIGNVRTKPAISQHQETDARYGVSSEEVKGAKGTIMLSLLRNECSNLSDKACDEKSGSSAPRSSTLIMVRNPRNRVE